MADKTLRKPSYTVEILTLICYTCAVAAIMIFHEPWFDEAQAWLIARDATIKELLTSITHYEGHPPVWYLILMPLAKLGVPFEWGIKSVNLALVATAMGLLIFKAPFPRIIRCTIPFTYFFFYQYGVISRSYSLMMLGFVLSALFYKDRQTKPFRFVLGLAIICGASAYGIVLAAGIALVWLAEIIGRPIQPGRLRSLLRDRRTVALLTLFVFAVLLLMTLYPYPDTFAANLEQQSSYLTRVLYMLTIAPADATCAVTYFASTIDIEWNAQVFAGIIAGCLINLALFFIVWMRHKRLLFILPYLCLAFFGGLVYFSTHHVGIITLFYLFVLWCCYDDKSKQTELPRFISKYISAEKDKCAIRFLGSFLLVILLGISIYWTLAASYQEIRINYGTGREAAAFIKKHRLEQSRIMTAWQKRANEDADGILYDFNMIQGAPTLAYFNSNIFMNLNNGQDNQCYLTHQINTNGATVRRFVNSDYPDLLYGIVDLSYIYDSGISIKNYSLVAVFHGSTIWKAQTHIYDDLIFMRSDLLSQYPSLVEITSFNQSGDSE